MFCVIKKKSKYRSAKKTKKKMLTLGGNIIKSRDNYYDILTKFCFLSFLVNLVAPKRIGCLEVLTNVTAPSTSSVLTTADRLATLTRKTPDAPDPRDGNTEIRLYSVR